MYRTSLVYSVIFFLWVGKGVAYHIGGERRDGRYEQREQMEEERGVGETGVVKTKEESGYCKE